MHRWSLVLSLCCALVAAAEDARTLFNEGKALYEKGDPRAAAVKFEESWAVRPLALTKFNLARCYQASGQPLKGIDAAQTYLLLSPTAEDRREVETSILKMGKTLAGRGVQALSVTSSPTGARVIVDGMFRGISPLTVELPPGHHLLQLEHEGRERVERSVSFTLDRPLLESLELPALRAPVIVVSPPGVLAPVRTEPPVVAAFSARHEDPPVASAAPWLIAGAVVAAAGAVGLGWSAVTWGRLQQQRVALPVPSTFVSREEFDRLQWAYPLSWVAAGVGLAALGVGVGLVIHGNAVRVTSQFQPGAASVTLTGRF